MLLHKAVLFILLSYIKSMAHTGKPFTPVNVVCTSITSTLQNYVFIWFPLMEFPCKNE